MAMRGRSWVAIKTVTPTALNASNSVIISRDSSGSKLPVGSSASNRDGR